MKKTKPISKRQKTRLVRMRRDPGGRVSLEIARYLETVGWRAIVSGPLQVRGVEKPGLGHYEFVMSFSGGRIAKPASVGAVARPDGVSTE